MLERAEDVLESESQGQDGDDQVSEDASLWELWLLRSSRGRASTHRNCSEDRGQVFPQ